MKKGERVLCLKRQRSNILGFQLTDILSIRSEYLSKKTTQNQNSQPPRHSLPLGLFGRFLHLGKIFHFIGMNFPQLV